MKLCHAVIVMISLFFLSACTTGSATSCAAQDCQQLDANNARLKVWWSAALRDGGGEYSTVSLND
ncbi:hypothetical protein NYP20_19135 [Pseudomonas sp. N3-W]|jgi:hypothetical protein|uniref:Type III secretion protein n=1 Tax=Pseudomonas fungipugnans TaxID=3024217 RepID=A0ABT6QJG8_9PSED|nr:MULTISPECIES: hypothetical protein [unclassified Pseudomonas]MDI2591016.1 hypothetical protein [Pseudomonas sp. 681]UWF47445.1 hypothetical protein NYP20_19135 [Pseudomonas sp. N3-W]